MFPGAKDAEEGKSAPLNWWQETHQCCVRIPWSAWEHVHWALIRSDDGNLLTVHPHSHTSNNLSFSLLRVGRLSCHVFTTCMACGHYAVLNEIWLLKILTKIYGAEFSNGFAWRWQTGSLGMCHLLQLSADIHRIQCRAYHKFHIRYISQDFSAPQSCSATYITRYQWVDYYWSQRPLLSPLHRPSIATAVRSAHRWHFPLAFIKIDGRQFCILSRTPYTTHPIN